MRFRGMKTAECLFLLMFFIDVLVLKKTVLNGIFLYSRYKHFSGDQTGLFEAELAV